MGDDPSSTPRVVPREEILRFFEKQAGARVDPGHTGDLLKDYGVDGDDAFAFIEAFAERYDVDVTGYCFFFHHRDSAKLMGRLPFARPDRHVRRIPISADMLVDFAERGTWDLLYPRTARQNAAARARREQRIIDRLLFLSLALLTVGIAWLWLHEAAAGAPDQGSVVSPC